MLTNPEFMEVSKASTLTALKGKVKEEELDQLLEHMEKLGGPGTIEAKAGIIFVGIYGNVECKPKNQPWEFDQSVWGIGAAGFTCLGLMYTAYDNWHAFFTQTTGFQAQGIADGGGIFQITWFNNSGTPIGQFNGAAAGLGVFEVGGKGKWKKK